MTNIPEHARGCAEQALVFLSGREADLQAFFAQSGAEPGAIRARVADPAFLGFVLDFILAEDERVLAFAAEAGMAPEAVAACRRALPGGEDIHWT